MNDSPDSTVYWSRTTVTCTCRLGNRCSTNSAEMPPRLRPGRDTSSNTEKPRKQGARRRRHHQLSSTGGWKPRNVKIGSRRLVPDRHILPDINIHRQQICSFTKIPTSVHSIPHSIFSRFPRFNSIYSVFVADFQFQPFNLLFQFLIDAYVYIETKRKHKNCYGDQMPGFISKRRLRCDQQQQPFIRINGSTRVFE